MPTRETGVLHVEVPACEEHRPHARQMLDQVEGSIKAIQEIAKLPFFIRWEADNLRQTKMPIEMRIRYLMRLCDINHNVSRGL